MDCRRSQQGIIGQGDTSASQETWDISPLLGNKKMAIKIQFPNWPMELPVSGSLACPYAAFPFSSLQMKCVWPLLLESTCAFTLRIDPRTLNTWKFLCGSVHYIWWCTKEHFFTWGWYRLCQTGGNWTWPWLSSTLKESVLQKSLPTMA
jgi:hypothetical protein